eukprot:TRINITY_DN5734_c0_g1_i1.p1 TRINITY_DN5734_c0_g1~~TRINITY_DN5734_c0_g1_i1.p1  ORF type:complete len:658 (-),score=71.51 TRINITY_DN5734_c0_g1_i1:185-2101(-)
MPPFPSFVPVMSCRGLQLSDFDPITFQQSGCDDAVDPEVNQTFFDSAERGFNSVDRLSASVPSAANTTMCAPKQGSLLGSDKYLHQPVGNVDEASVAVHLQRFETVLVASVAKLENAVASLALCSAAHGHSNPTEKARVPSNPIQDDPKMENNDTFQKVNKPIERLPSVPSRLFAPMQRLSTGLKSIPPENNHSTYALASAIASQGRSSGYSRSAWSHRQSVKLSSSVGQAFPSAVGSRTTCHSFKSNQSLPALIYGSTPVKVIIAMAVFVSTVTFALQVNDSFVEGTNANADPIEAMCMVIFTLELMLRFLVLGNKMCQRMDVLFAIDILIVMFGWFEIISVLIMRGRDVRFNLESVMTFIRAGRSLRLCRVMFFLPQVRVVFSTIVSSLDSLFWLCILVTCVIYGFAITLTAGVGRFVNQQVDVSDTLMIDLRRQFGSVIRSTYTLFMAVSGGVSWGEPASLMLEVGPSYFAVYIIYISLMLFSVLNILTGFFVDSAIQLMQRDRDLCTTRALAKNKHLLDDMRELLELMDVDKSGSVSWEEWLLALESSQACTLMSVLGLDVDEGLQMFELLDNDCSGVLSVEELLTSLVRVNSTATALQLDMVLRNTHCCSKMSMDVARIEQRLGMATEEHAHL